MPGSVGLYETFGNEIKYKITENTLITYLENSTINFPLPEASADLLSDFADIDSIDPTLLETVKARLENIGFSIPKAKTMASILIKVADSQGVSPMEYFEVNEKSLKLAIDTYKTINLFRPVGNQIGLKTPVKNSQGFYGKMIKP